jgi:hypothetical protein
MPRGLFDLMALGNSYTARSDAYLYLLTETYPPFQDEGTRTAGMPGTPPPEPPGREPPASEPFARPSIVEQPASEPPGGGLSGSEPPASEEPPPARSA